MVTDQQVRRLKMFIKNQRTKAIAAAKAGMDEKTARKYVKLEKMPSETKKDHCWQTREDPFDNVWEEIKRMIQTNHGLEATTIFEYLQRENPGKYIDGQLRTLQRRLKHWRATEGPAKEVFFLQEHHPGELSESDFTHMTKLGITIGGEVFEHLIYHFVLTYSNWETGTICFSESFESLSAGYQNAVWELGGATKKHRTDRMSSAVNKACHPEKFTHRYNALMRHYGVAPQRTNPGSANENGDVEQRHYRFKKAVGQALMLRGSQEFSTFKEYKNFLRKIFDQLNTGRQQKLQEELMLLHKLPMRRINDYKQLEVRVGPSSTIHVQGNVYSVHSRLIKEKVQVKIYVDYLEVWYANKKVEQIPRLRGKKKSRIQYQHIIDWLVRKPGAFENYRYKSEMFPSSYFRMTYDYLKRENSLRANKEYVTILYIAAKEGELLVESAIRELLSNDKKISQESVKELIAVKNQFPKVTDVNIDNIILSEYDELLNVKKEVLVYE